MARLLPSLLSFIVFLPFSLQSPCKANSTTLSRSTSNLASNTSSSYLSAATQPICQQNWVKGAKQIFNILPNGEGYSLCSSVLSKYQTVTTTKTIVTGTATLTSVIEEASTAPQATISTTVTIEIPDDVAATTTIDSEFDVTVVPTVVVTTTDVVEARGAPPTGDCTVQLASLLGIATSVVSDFCSCEAPGSTSTTAVTVTQAVAATSLVSVTSITTVATPAPVYVIATETDMYTTTVSTETDIASVTSTVTAPAITSLQTVLATEAPCPASGHTGSIAGANTFVYTQYFAGYGVSEQSQNPGNMDAASPPISTSIPGTVPDCNAIDKCTSFAVNGAGIYYSFDLHYLEVEGVWECVAYYNGNANPAYFSDANPDIGRAYGFDIS